MSDKTKIEWTDATWNPIVGCSVVSPGCTNCYAMRLAGTRRAHHPSRAGLTTMTKAGPVWNGQVRLYEPSLHQPLQWKRPRRIFVCAHGDLFHESVPDEWIDRVFAVMALAPQHVFQVLTKRSARMREYVSRTLDQWHGNADNFADRFQDAMDWNLAWINDIDDMQWPLANVWLGVSAERQQEADERIPDLLATPAAVKFVSAEPLLGPIDITRWLHPRSKPNPDGYGGDEAPGWTTDFTHLDWIIVGGESGPGARPMHPAWARSIRDQCMAAGVAFHFKQHGEWLGEDQFASGVIRGEPEEIHVWPDRYVSARVGKKRAGRRLDGVEHDAFPGGPHAYG
jgi:protein gp37